MVCNLVCRQSSGHSSSNLFCSPGTEEIFRGFGELGGVVRKELEYMLELTGEHLCVDVLVRTNEQPRRDVANKSIFPNMQFSRL